MCTVTISTDDPFKSLFYAFRFTRIKTISKYPLITTVLQIHPSPFHPTSSYQPPIVNLHKPPSCIQ